MHDFPMRRTHAPALSDAFNNTNCGHGQSSNQEDRVICLLCRAVVLLNTAASPSQGNLMKRSRMLKNLCHHMQISSTVIPPKCSTTTHPLCKTCEDHMSNLWKLQGVLDKVGLEISKIVKGIKQSVFDDHVTNTGIPPQQSAAVKRVTILKEKIMEGYRNNLLMNPPASNENPPVVIRVNKVEVDVNQEDADAVVMHDPLTPSSSWRTGDDDDDEEEESGVVEMDSDVGLNVGYESRGSQQSQEEIVISSDESMDFEESEDMKEDHDDEDAANVVAGADGAEAKIHGGRATVNATAPFSERVQMEQEAVENPLLEANEEDDHDVGDYFGVGNLVAVELHEEGRLDGNSGSVGFAQVNQGGSMVLVTQEENKADYNEEERNQDHQIVAPANVCVPGGYGTSASPLQKKRQCHICNYTIIIPNKDMSARAASVSQMRMHIHSAHEGEILKWKEELMRTRCQLQPTRMPYLLTCGRCSATFDTKESLTEHKNTQHIITCEICKRPFPPNRKQNLSSHLFSHKNQEERNAACRAGERGARAGILANRSWGKNPKALKTPRMFTCSICQRTFSGLNYYNIHMWTHQNRRMETCSLASAPAPEPQHQQSYFSAPWLGIGVRK